MIKEINKDKLKTKHLINIDTEAEIDKVDFLYQFFQAYEEKDWDINTKASTLAQLKWAGVDKPIHNRTIEESIDLMIELGWVKPETKNGTLYYEVVNHPW